MKYILANWKAHKNIQEAKEWMSTFKTKVLSDTTLLDQLQNNDLKIIICPPFPFIPLVHEELSSLANVTTGAQDLSTIEEGKYTGEVTAKTLTGLVEYVLIGHSERRTHFRETEEEISKKIQMAKKYHIEPVLCISSEKNKIYEGVKIVLYEPPSAIGSGHNAELSDVINMKHRLNLPSQIHFLYGGSVDEKNVLEYFSSPEIHGFIAATASYDPIQFYNTIAKCR